jgi:O-antigen/teichoic acid export membrane protein
MMWLRNIATNYLRFGVNLIVMVVMTPILIQAVGIENYGLWAIVYAAIGIVSLSDLGFSTAAIKYLSESNLADKTDELDKVVGALLIVYLGLTLICTVLVIAAFKINLTPLPSIFLLLGAATSISLACSVHRAAIIAVGKQDAVNWLIITGSIVQAIVTYGLLKQGYGIYGVALVHSVSLICQSLLCLPLAYYYSRFRPNFSSISTYVLRIGRFSIWALIANTSLLLILRIDPLILERYLTLADVAVYAIALKVGEQILYLNKQFSNALLPLVSSLQGVNQKNARSQLLLFSTRYLLLFATPVAALLCINAQDLVELWVGPVLSSAALPLSVLAIAAWVSTTQFNAANINGLSGHPRIVAISMALSAASKVTFGIILVMNIGIVGAAFASLIGAVVFEATINLSHACRITGTSFTLLFQKAILPGVVCTLPACVFATLDHTHTSLIDLIMMNALYGTTTIMAFYFYYFDDEDRAFFTHYFNQGVKTPCVESTAS